MKLYLTHWVTKAIENGSVVLFNWKSNDSVEIFDINHPAYNFYQNPCIEINKENLSEEYKDDIEWLIQENFIISNEKLIYLENTKNKYSRKEKFQLILLPAGEACNLDCVYCYEDHSNRKSMGKEHQATLLRFIKKQNPQSVSIEYFGGEPMLNMPFIIQFGELLKKNDIVFSASITTNATLITEKTLAQLYAANVKTFQITLDGYKELHNKLRPSKNGSIDSFDNVSCAIKTIANSSYEDIIVTIRLNVNNEAISDEHFSKFSQTLASLIPPNDKRFFILPKIISDYSSSNLINNEQAKDFYCKTKESANSVMEKFERLISEKYQSSSALLLTSEGGFACYAGNPYSYTITPDFKIRKCTVALNDPINTVGYLENDGELKRTIYFDLWNKDYSDQYCTHCFLNKSCQGNSCPLANIKNDRKICPPIKQQTELLTLNAVNFYKKDY